MKKEIGYQTSPRLPGWIALDLDSNEDNPQLKYPRNIKVYERMRREDSQITSVLRAVTLPIYSTRWQIDANQAPPHVVEHIAADLGLQVKGQAQIERARTRGRFSWTEHLRLALTCLVFGHSFFEQVYEPIDGKLRLKKLAWRPPATISKINVARDGGLESIEQQTIGSKPVIIPVSQLVAYINDREGGNWAGHSLLRGAYKNWLLKDRMLRAQALTVERNGLGVPVHTQAPLPDNIRDTDGRREWLEAQKEDGLALATSFRAGETAGVTLPYGATLELLGVKGTLPDTDQPIRYQDEQIARAVLAHFLNLGTETGSWALGSTFAEFFTNSLNAVAENIAAIVQQHVIEDLVDLNYGQDTPAPRIVYDPIGGEQPATAESIKALIDCGALNPDPQLEAHIRARYGLPNNPKTQNTGQDTNPLTQEDKQQYDTVMNWWKL